MSNPDMWEKRLESWRVRQPSDRIAREIFEKRAAQGGNDPRRSRSDAPYHLWNFLTPVAACCLTLVVLCGSYSHRLGQFQSRDNATYFATLMLDVSSSNVAPQTFALSKVDENIEWNVWPHATLPATNFGAATSRAQGFGDAVRTNGGARGATRPTNGIFSN